MSSVIVKGDSNLVSGNIKSRTSIFGVSGNYSGKTPNIIVNTSTSFPTLTTLKKYPAYQFRYNIDEDIQTQLIAFCFGFTQK